MRELTMIILMIGCTGSYGYTYTMPSAYPMNTDDNVSRVEFEDYKRNHGRTEQNKQGESDWARTMREKREHYERLK